MDIDLNTKIVDIKTGKALVRETPTNGMTEAIRLHISNYKIKDVETLKADLAMWQEKLGATTKKDLTVRALLLDLFSNRFKTTDVRENFWVTEIGVICSNESKKILELDKGSDKYTFVKRIIENNKVIIGQGPQEKEVDIFFPYVVGQLLMALEGKKVDLKVEVKEEIKEEDK